MTLRPGENRQSAGLPELCSGITLVDVEKDGCDTDSELVITDCSRKTVLRTGSTVPTEPERGDPRLWPDSISRVGLRRASRTPR